MAFIFKSLSQSCYICVREYFDLPHPKELERLSCSLNSNDNAEYFASLENGMSFEEKHVALFVNKMKVKENVQLNNGKIFGLALNETEQGKDTLARHIMTWMIQSQAGLMNEAVCMVPVSCMTDEEITNPRTILSRRHYGARRFRPCRDCTFPMA